MHIITVTKFGVSNLFCSKLSKINLRGDPPPGKGRVEVGSCHPFFDPITEMFIEMLTRVTKFFEFE